MMVFGGGNFGNWWGHEAETLMNGINVHTQEAWESSLASFPKWSYDEKMVTYEPDNRHSPDAEKLI